MTAMLGWVMEDFLSHTLMLPFVNNTARAIYNTPKSKNDEVYVISGITKVKLMLSARADSL